jgi:protein-disulfide isomerase
VRAAAVAVAAALCLIPASPTVAKPAPARDWSQTVVATPEGGFRMGNPAAKVKLVEYGSLACPHCRHFEQTGYKPLVQGYVRTGKVSYEFRNFLINGPDIAISVLTRCAGPAKFYPMSEVVYATQHECEKKFDEHSDADKAALEKMSDKERIVRFAEIGGMPQIAARFGVTPAQAKQCLSDSKKLQQLLDMTKTAMDSGITHTPTFVIDGKVSDVTTWEELEPQLKAALGGNG